MAVVCEYEMSGQIHTLLPRLFIQDEEERANRRWSIARIPPSASAGWGNTVTGENKSRSGDNVSCIGKAGINVACLVNGYKTHSLCLKQYGNDA